MSKKISDENISKLFNERNKLIAKFLKKTRLNEELSANNKSKLNSAKIPNSKILKRIIEIDKSLPPRVKFNRELNIHTYDDMSDEEFNKIQIRKIKLINKKILHPTNNTNYSKLFKERNNLIAKFLQRNNLNEELSKENKDKLTEQYILNSKKLKQEIGYRET